MNMAHFDCVFPGAQKMTRDVLVRFSGTCSFFEDGLLIAEFLEHSQQSWYADETF